jgi:branched-chain amino acid transport system substrate-binding protein
MHKRTRRLTAVLAVVCVMFASLHVVYAADPLVIGVPTSTGFLEGREALKAVQLAVEEINAAGGVTVGGTKRLFVVESIDIRDAAPGVPVPEALLGIEKIILEKKPVALVVGPFRSEALVAAMDLIARHKVPLIGTIAMTPASEKLIKENPEKYKYIFRTCLNAPYLVKYLIGTMSFIKEQFGFDTVYIMNQDVAWARQTADLTTKLYFEKAGWTVVGHETYPTGSSDFSASLMRIRNDKAQVILPIFDMPQSGTLVRQWNSMKVPALMAGFISPLAGPGAWNTFRGNIPGAINVNFELGSAIASTKYPATQTFLDAYQKRWGVPIEAGHGIAPAYEGVYILAEAIERAGNLDPDAIADEIMKTDRTGVMGRIRFDEGHQAVYDMDPQESALAAVFQWTADGGRTIIFPQSIAEGVIQLPEGLKSAK